MIFLGFCSPFLMLRLFAMCVVIGFLNLSTVDSRSLEYKVDSLSCFNSPGQKQNLFSLGNYAVTWSQCRKTWVQIPTQLFNNHGSQNKACESWQRCWCVCAKCLFLEKNEKKKHLTHKAQLRSFLSQFLFPLFSLGWIWDVLSFTLFPWKNIHPNSTTLGDFLLSQLKSPWISRRRNLPLCIFKSLLKFTAQNRDMVIITF